MESGPKPIVGINKPKMGVQNLTWFDIFDFQVGDVIHVKSSYSSLDGIGSHQTKQITTILNRTDFVSIDGSLEYIEYTQKIEKLVLTFNTSGPTGSYLSVDTIIRIIQNSETSQSFEYGFDELPGYPFSYKNGDRGNYAQNSMYYTGPFLTKYSPGSSEYICNWNPNFEDCWGDCIIDGESGDLYYKGLGGPYYDYYYSWGQSSSHVFVYFEKGDSIVGTPLDLTSVPEYFNAQLQLNIFPNPAKEYIQVQTNPKDLPATFELFGAQGDQILIHEIRNPGESINLQPGNTGIAIAKITTKKGYYNTQKILINR